MSPHQNYLDYQIMVSSVFQYLMFYWLIQVTLPFFIKLDLSHILILIFFFYFIYSLCSWNLYLSIHFIFYDFLKVLRSYLHFLKNTNYVRICFVFFMFFKIISSINQISLHANTNLLSQNLQKTYFSNVLIHL